MLIQALVDEFMRFFDRADHHHTVLWFDPEGESAALLGHLPAALPPSAGRTVEHNRVLPTPAGARQ